jgi:hypothetical protein
VSKTQLKRRKEKRISMKSKKLLLRMSLIPMLFLSMVGVAMAGTCGPPASGAPWNSPPTVASWSPPSEPPYVWLYAGDYEFNTTEDLTSPSYASFNVSINLHNFTAQACGGTGGLGAIDFVMYYNTSVLTAARVFLSSDTQTYLGDYVGLVSPYDDQASINDAFNASYGKIRWGGIAANIYAPGNVSNVGMVWTLVTINFNITLAPDRDLAPPPELNVSSLLDFSEQDVVVGWVDGTSSGDCTLNTHFGVDDGSYIYIRPQMVPGAPVAAFDWTPTVVYECTDVILDASDTTDGGYPPLTYSWTIENLTGNATLTGADNTETTTMHCDSAGDVNVTLTATNNISYVDSISHIIEQRERAGCQLDVYTSTNRFCGQVTTKVGIGPDAPADALTPDVNFTIFAQVLWNGKPVMHVLVAFEVLWEYAIDWAAETLDPVPKNECIAYRTAETDKDGIAQIWLRVPTPCETPVMGKWLVIATAKIQEVKQIDTMRFDVGYLLNIIETWTTSDGTPDDAFCAPCDLIGFGADVRIIAQMPKNVALVWVVYDDCDVPIGQWIARREGLPTAEYCSPATYSIDVVNAFHIPQWTYVGTGKLYLSAFTRLPSECGTPYCPEKSHEFLLEWCPP